MPFYPTPGAIVTFETDFIPKGEQILRASRQTTRILNRQMTIAEEGIASAATVIMQNHTPVGPDAWHHAGGSLRRMTDTIIGVGDESYSSVEGISGISGVMQQYSIEITQPAENPYGTQYAPFVILGHLTRGAMNAEPGRHGALRDAKEGAGAGWVAPNPYPERAVPEIVAMVNAVLDKVARATAEETVRMMSYQVGA